MLLKGGQIVKTPITNIIILNEWGEIKELRGIFTNKDNRVSQFTLASIVVIILHCLS